MEKQPNIIGAIGELWGLLRARRRRQFYVLILIMIAASLAEIFSLGLIVPFLLVLAEPARVMSQPLVSGVLGAIGLTDPSHVIIAITAAFCVATLIAGAVRLLLLYASTGFAFALGADISLDIYRRALYQPYEVHVARNSTETINSVMVRANEITYSVVVQLLTLTSAAFLVLGIVGTLFVINPGMTAAAIGAFVLIYGSIMWLTRKRIQRDSQIISTQSPRVVKALQEGLGGIRDVLIDSTQETFVDIYRTADRAVRAAQGRITLTSGSPRFLVEGLGMIFIALLAVSASRAGGDASVIPMLGALALGAQRLLPVVQQAYHATISIRGAEASLREVVGLLGQPILDDPDVPANKIAFDREIRLENLSFRYAGDGPDILKGINLTIPRGARVGIFGPTGGGKSTMVDLLMGLLQPSAGALTVDGVRIDVGNRRGWRAHLAHVPQAIFLSDASVAENIAFGVRPADIDLERVKRAAALANIAGSIESWPRGYDTHVGERGVRLSGGQRQRIGIARALYKQADVIVFDEATSALDGETEREVISAIGSLSSDLTIIMIAHRLTTLKGCDLLLQVVDGRIRIADPAELDGAR